MLRSYPTTETLPVITTTGLTESFTQLAPVKRRPITVDIARAPRQLYNAVASFDMRHPGLISDEARFALLRLRDAFFASDNLALFLVCLAEAVEATKPCVVVASDVHVFHAIAEAERFLQFFS